MKALIMLISIPVNDLTFWVQFPILCVSSLVYQFSRFETELKEAI